MKLHQGFPHDVNVADPEELDVRAEVVVVRVLVPVIPLSDALRSGAGRMTYPAPIAWLAIAFIRGRASNSAKV